MAQSSLMVPILKTGKIGDLQALTSNWRSFELFDFFLRVQGIQPPLLPHQSDYQWANTEHQIPMFTHYIGVHCACALDGAKKCGGQINERTDGNSNSWRRILLCGCATPITVPLNCQLDFMWQGRARQDTWYQNQGQNSFLDLPPSEAGWWWPVVIISSCTIHVFQVLWKLS